jgi:phage shock protein PspC (stress-responsive transcriptional regulator)
MNKTVTINISGIIFHIEEDAYDTLSKYLLTIKSYFSKADGGTEIMSDIEARIAEMLQSKTSAIKQVVLMSDVDFVMESMGKPEEFGGDSSDSNSSENHDEQTDNINGLQNVKKRLYRDGDSKVLGGVCSGIGHYFGFDPVWLRIALALLLVFAGSGVLIYIILWIAIPEAKTTAEKLAMKGEKADINNISKAVKEEAEHLKKRMEKYGDEFKNMAHNHRDVPRNAVEKIVDFVTDVLMNVGRVLLKVIGIFMVIFGVIFFLGLFSSVFGLSFMMDSNNGGDWIDLLLLDGKDFYLGIIGIAIFVGTPIVMMIYGGIKILFKVHFTNRWVNLSAGIIWLFGFLLLLYVGIRTGKDFSKDAKVRENITLKQYDTLYLKMNELPINFDEINENETDETDRTYYHNRRRPHNDYMIGKNNNIKYLLGHAQLNIIKSQSEAIELVIVKEAKGGDRKDASDRSKNIVYKVSQLDSLILCDNIFKVNNADKFRVQNVKVILKMPVGKVVYLDKSLEFMLNDVDNTTNTYDGDMINRRWIMTEKGLKCLDCKGLDEDSSNTEGDENDSDNSSKNENVKITVNGVDIKAKDSQVKLDSNGVKIKSKTTKLTIDEKGIHIDTEKKK